MSDNYDLLEQIRDKDDEIRELRDDIKNLEDEIDSVLDEKKQMQDRIDDLNAQLLQIQLLRNGDGHLIGDILRITNSFKDPNNAIDAIRGAIDRWYKGGDEI
jgi:chromosome segregation ATPase